MIGRNSIEGATADSAWLLRSTSSSSGCSKDTEQLLLEVELPTSSLSGHGSNLSTSQALTRVPIADEVTTAVGCSKTMSAQRQFLVHGKIHSVAAAPGKKNGKTYVLFRNTLGYDHNRFSKRTYIICTIDIPIASKGQKTFSHTSSFMQKSIRHRDCSLARNPITLNRVCCRGCPLLGFLGRSLAWRV